MICCGHYHAFLALIARSDLDASSVYFPYYDDDGPQTYAKVLLDKRYLGWSALGGKEPVQLWSVCHDPFWVKAPTLSILIDLCRPTKKTPLEQLVCNP